jgi:antitoxin ChpS
MAIYSKRSEDPTEVALDAIQEALNNRDAVIQPATEGSAAAITDSIAASAGTRTVVTLRSVGGSIIVAIPKPLLEGLGLAPNMTVGLSIDHGRLVIEARPRPRYSLAELLAKCDPSAPASEEDRLWDAAEPIGREVF